MQLCSMSDLTPILISSDRWTEILNQVVESRGMKYRLSFVLKRDMGWTPRLMRDDHNKVYIDFWTAEAKSMFLLEFGVEGHLKQRKYL